jgi:peptidoglycan hydrolase FlgJ
MDILPLQRPVKASDLPLERMAGNTKLSDSDKVAEVSRQFEAVLLRQIIGESQKPVFGSSPLANSVSNEIYRDMITNQLADSISKSGAFGLARCLQPQLTHQLVRAPKTGENNSPPLKSNNGSPAAGYQPAPQPQPMHSRAAVSSGIRLEPHPR